MKAAGFSLVEVLVATAVVVVGVTSLAQLFTASARASRIADATTMTLLLAQERMENLRADSDAANSSPSPPAALSANTPGYFEYVDRTGVSLGDPTTPPPGAVYVRRWAIEALEGPSGSAGNTIVLKVLVIQLTGGLHSNEGSGVTPLSSVSAGQASAPGEARLVSLKTRRAG